MARPIWTGTISFGLLNIPVQLMPAERRVDLRFHMLDSRDHKRVRYERVNSETGEEVPWKDVVKAFEYDKGSYVVLEKQDIARAAPDSRDSVDIETFIDPSAVSLRYFDRPYFLVPAGKAEKGYALLRETLHEQRKAGLSRVVIRTREYLALVVPEDTALLLLLLRYPQELIAADEYQLPERSPKKSSGKKYRLTPREIEMASELVQSMSSEWTPANYRDDFRERLRKIVSARVRKKGKRGSVATEASPPASANVVDFMTLLKKSIAEKRRTPAARKRSKPTATRGAQKPKRASRRTARQ